MGPSTGGKENGFTGTSVVVRQSNEKNINRYLIIKFYSVS